MPPLTYHVFNPATFNPAVFNTGLTDSHAPALMYALSDVMRSNANRSNYTSPKLFVALDGTQYATARPVHAEEAKAETLVIADILDEVPNTASVSVKGFTPTVGQELVITLGSMNNRDRLFAGHVMTVDRVYVGVPENPTFHLNATDYSYLLNRFKVTKRYTNQSATTVARDLIATYAPGFTSLRIQADLPFIDEITFTFQEFGDAMTQLAKRIGAYWYVDYQKHVHLFLTDIVTDPTELTVGLIPRFWDFAPFWDLSQVITRVLIEGGGVNAVAELAPGDTIIPLDDTAWYSSTGGQVVSGPQRINYTGIQEPGAGAVVGTGSLPSVAPSLALQAGSGLGTGTYRYAYTDVTAAGESLPSPLSSITTGGEPTTAPTISTGATMGGGLTPGAIYKWKVTFVSAAGETAGGVASADYTAVGTGFMGQSFVAVITNIPIGPVGTTARKLYRTVANGSSYFLVITTPINDNSTTTWSDGSTDASLGAAMPTAVLNQVAVSGIAVGPASTTARKLYRTVVGGSQLKLLTTLADNTTTTFPDSTADGSLGANVPTTDTSGLTQPQGQINAGSTTMPLSSTGPFSAGGGWVRIGGDQVIRYSGISGNSLTGIPAVGSGAIGATIMFNSTVTVAPALTGIPAVGAGAIAQPILIGDPVNILVQVDDLDAQSTIASLMGFGDGVKEEYVQDRRLSLVEATARGQAILALRSEVEIKIRTRTLDLNARAGRSYGVALPSVGISGSTFKIQEVRLTEFPPGRFPTRDVSASTTRFSFEDLLRLARKAAA